MKRYLLNHNCIYNEEKNEIRNTDNAVIIKMTAMRARCLSFIIENSESGVIDKQQLTYGLWGERGQFISDANLTQLLYLIRKDLRTLGINDFFMTIPRVGIRINNNITIETLPEERLKRRYKIWKTAIVMAFIISIISLYAVLDMIKLLSHN
ncbi:transcriptional regulator [Scandinavium sp. M-37]|jgi:DNA-binding winged helix-turn-helix (wHTH) protein|uniref:winged helix-turn-helix domain-containing protein n=1 Tax=Scandinavium sp. M-37 TaxID=3373077 RepID=UPI003746BEA9